MNLAKIDYTNWRGERRIRVVHPFEWKFGSNEWHPEPGWMMHATDVESGKSRWFVLRNIHSWEDLPDPSLIERLRKLAASCDDRAAVGEPNDPEGMAELLREAAAEIQALRAKVNHEPH